jgi:UDP-N-acetylglucosamine--N-acetylmuramyl-(pentapeptide) pyrophosphoryl-undecaprenol N-acetylglucosamine transferase
MQIFQSKSYESINGQGFRGQNFIKKLHVYSKCLLNIFKVIKIISKEKIDGMIGFGGFITVPAGIGCWLKRKPVFLHEQNAVLGSANKLITKISKLNFLGFPIEGISKSVISGNPIRRSFVNKSEKLNNNR